MSVFNQNLIVILLMISVLTMIAYIVIRAIFSTQILDDDFMLMIFCEMLIWFFILYNLLTLRLYRFTSTFEYVLLFFEVIIINYAVINFVGKILIEEMYQYGGIDKFVHILATFSMFNIMRSISRSLVGIEKDKKVSFTDYSSTFVLMMFWMIGIWIIHPRLQKIISKRL